MVVEIGIAPFETSLPKRIPDLKPQPEMRRMMPRDLLVLHQHQDVGAGLLWDSTREELDRSVSFSRRACVYMRVLFHFLTLSAQSTKIVIAQRSERTTMAKRNRLVSRISNRVYHRRNLKCNRISLGKTLFNLLIYAVL